MPPSKSTHWSLNQTHCSGLKAEDSPEFSEKAILLTCGSLYHSSVPSEFTSWSLSRLNNVERYPIVILFVSTIWNFSFTLPSNMINSITPNYSNENKIQCLSIKHTKWPLWPDSETTQTRESLLQSLKPDIQLKHAHNWESSVTRLESPCLKNCCVNPRLRKWKFWYWKTRALGSILLWVCDGRYWPEIWLYKFRKRRFF